MPLNVSPIANQPTFYFPSAPGSATGVTSTVPQTGGPSNVQPIGDSSGGGSVPVATDASGNPIGTTDTTAPPAQTIDTSIPYATVSTPTAVTTTTTGAPTQNTAANGSGSTGGVVTQPGYYGAGNYIPFAANNQPSDQTGTAAAPATSSSGTALKVVAIAAVVGVGFWLYYRSKRTTKSTPKKSSTKEKE